MADYDTVEEIDDDARQLAEIQVRYEAARDHASQWRKEARECYAMYSGEQWSSTDVSKMIEQQRTPVSFNRVAILIDAVIGYEVNNRQETKYIGRTQGDAAVNEQLSEAARYFRDQCEAEFAESDAFRDMAICGMGWTNDRLTDERSPEYDLWRDRVDPFEMFWDPSVKKPCLVDGRYVFRRKMLDKAEAKAIFPDWDGAYSPAEWLHEGDDDSEEVTVKDPRNSYQGDNDIASARRDVPVLEYQYMESEPVHLVTNPQTGQKLELSEEEFKKLPKETLEVLKGGQIPHQDAKRNVWKRCFLIGAEIVKKDQPYPKGCTYHCVTGKRDRNRGYWFGLMKGLMDPQRWSNKFLAQIMHLVNTGAKTGYDIEEGAVKDQSKFETNAAKPGAVSVFTDGALQKGRVQRREVQGLPPDLANLLEYANNSMSDTSGVNQELLGMADREQAGVLEYQRKQSAVTLLAPLFDSFRLYRKISGRCWLYFMQKYMTDGRLIRITQDEQEVGQKEANVNFTEKFFDEGVSEYDVIIDQGSSSPNLKEATWGALQPLLPMLAERMGPEEIMLVLDYAPVPESFVQKLREITAKKAQQPPPPDPDMMKAEAQVKAKQAELQMKQQAEERSAQMEMEKAKMEAMLQQQASQQEMVLERLKAQQEMQIEMMKAMNELRVSGMKAQNETQIAQQKAQTDAQIARQRASDERQTSQVKTSSDIANADALAKAKAKAISKGNGARKQ